MFLSIDLYLRNMNANGNANYNSTYKSQSNSLLWFKTLLHVDISHDYCAERWYRFMTIIEFQFTNIKGLHKTTKLILHSDLSKLIAVYSKQYEWCGESSMYDIKSSLLNIKTYCCYSFHYMSTVALIKPLHALL